MPGYSLPRICKLLVFCHYRYKCITGMIEIDITGMVMSSLFLQSHSPELITTLNFVFILQCCVYTFTPYMFIDKI